MTKLNKVYSDSEEKYLEKVVLYGHTDTYLYADTEHTDGNTVGAEEVMNLCKKGLLLVDDGTKVYAPVSFAESAGTVSVDVVTTGSGAELKTFKSKEPTEGE